MGRLFSQKKDKFPKTHQDQASLLVVTIIHFYVKLFANESCLFFFSLSIQLDVSLLTFGSTNTLRELH